MGKETERAIYEIAWRVRLLRMLKEEKGNLNEREIFLLELLDIKDNLSVSELASLYPSVSSSTISNTITKLWKDKLVKKTINPENQRITTVSLTPKGREVVEETKKLNEKIYKIIATSLNLTEEEDKLFINILQRGVNFFNQRLESFDPLKSLNLNQN